MSIQSTAELTREEAEDKLFLEWLNNEDRARGIKMIIKTMGDEELENALESQFDNYRIINL